MGGMVREEGFGRGARCLGTEHWQGSQPTGDNISLPGQPHARGTAYLVKPPGKGHNVGGETMFLLLTPSTAGQFLGSTESISTAILIGMQNTQLECGRTGGEGQSPGHSYLQQGGRVFAPSSGEEAWIYRWRCIPGPPGVSMQRRTLCSVTLATFPGTSVPK